jgi:hypothetical protein
MVCLPPSSRFVAAGLSRVGTNRPLGKSPCVTSTNSMDEAMSQPRAKKRKPTGLSSQRRRDDLLLVSQQDSARCIALLGQSRPATAGLRSLRQILQLTLITNTAKDFVLRQVSNAVKP